MLRCQETGLIFSREILEDSTLQALYKDSLVTFGEQTEYIKRDYWAPLAPHLQGRPMGRALDIGCSNGFFLEVLLDNGFAEVHGCEPSTQARDLARADVRPNIHTGFYQPGLYPSQHFDLITCFQTLDHLSDPLAMLQTMYTNTRPGGLAYLVMHDTRALQARIFGERSPIIDVEHIYLFNQANLARLCQMAGFKVIRTFSLRNGYPLSYWLRMAPLPFKPLLTTLLRKLRLQNKVLRIHAGNMGVLLERAI